MITKPNMLIEPAKKAGMKVPDPSEGDENGWFINWENYPHFRVFCIVQLNRKLSSWTEHWDNAHVIARLTEEECKTITLGQLIDKGLMVLL